MSLVGGDEGPAVDDRRRDGLGPEEGAQLEQAHGGRGALAELVDRGPPHGADGAGVAGRLLRRAPARAGRSAARCRWRRGCRSPSARLPPSRRRWAGRRASRPAGRVSSGGQGGDLAPEELDALGPGEGVDVDRLHARVRRPGAVAGGHDQHVGRAGRRARAAHARRCRTRRCRRSAATGRGARPAGGAARRSGSLPRRRGPRRPVRDQPDGRASSARRCWARAGSSLGIHHTMS